MDAITQHGRSVAFAAFNSRDFVPIFMLARDARSPVTNRAAAGLQAFLSAIVELSRFIDGARAAGFRFTPEPPNASAMVYRAAISETNVWNDALLILEAAMQLVRVAPGIRVTENVPEPQPAPAPSAEPTPSGAPQPIEVRVVSMPTRQTTSHIERDKNGNIASASQIEKDLAI
jgi:hypothetical protein